MTDFPQFPPNFSMLLVGASNSGKSSLMNRLLTECSHVFSEKFDRIYWCYAEESSVSNKIKGVTYVKGFPSDEILENHAKTPMLLILDDLQSELDQRVSLIFTRKCHHNSISCVVMLQNLFFQSSVARDIALNARFLLIFKVSYMMHRDSIL